MSRFPRRLRAVIFDLDGTLVDTADEFVVVVQALRAEHGLEPMDAGRIRQTVSNGARALVTLGLGLAEDHPHFEDRRLRLLELYSEVLGTAAAPYPGITELLSAMAERNIGWAVATNKPRAYTHPLLDRLGFDPAPASIVCPDDVKDRKPHPESLYLNCRHLDCSPADAVYIGDHRRDIEAGRRAGMFTVAAGYGYIEPDDDPDDWGASARIDDSRDLFDLLLNS